jgi:hypothetical protein
LDDPSPTRDNGHPDQRAHALRITVIAAGSVAAAQIFIPAFQLGMFMMAGVADCGDRQKNVPSLHAKSHHSFHGTIAAGTVVLH